LAETYAEPELLRPKPHRRDAYVFLAPAMAILFVFFILPVFWILYVSVSEYEPVTATSQTVWLDNYREVVTSPAVWRSVLNTVYFGLVYVPLTLLLAGCAAWLFSRCIRSRPLLRAVFCAPIIVPVVAAALIWRAAYAPYSGSIDRLLYLVGYEHGAGWAGWLYEPYLAMPCIAVMCAWRDLGLFALLLLSAFGRIPKSTYELARLDGVSRWQMLTKITIPLCSGTLALCLIMLVINVQNVFQEIFVMTEDGGPANWTVNIPFLVYRYTYTHYDWGRAAALSTVLFAVTVIVILIQNRMLTRRLNWD